MPVPTAPTPTTRPLVLVVDDSLMQRRLMQRALNPVCREILLAESGEAALEVLSRKEVDLIFCDLRMPGLGGLGLLREVPARFRKRFVFCSGSDDRNTELEDTPLLLKPVTIHTLRSVVDKMTRGAQADASGAS